MNLYDGNPFPCKYCGEFIFWHEGLNIFANMYDNPLGSRGSRHADSNRTGLTKNINTPEPLTERKITAKDLEIVKCNPKKHNYVPEILANIYGPINTDRWLCNNCKDHGDKWGMMCHPCKGYYEFHYNSKTTQKLNTKKGVK